MSKRKYHVEVLEYGTMYPEWNKHFYFDSLEAALSYCKELDFHHNEFILSAYNNQE